MMTLKVKDKTYQLRFNYRVLGRTNIVERILELANIGDGASDAIQKMIDTTAEMLLASLQKYHKDEFGYITDEQKSKKLDAIYDMLDDLEDDGTDAYTLFNALQEELSANGFLSKMSETPEENLEEKPQKKTASKK